MFWLALLLAGSAVATEPIRVAVSGMPTSRGDPFGRTWLPPLLTHAAIFDPLTMVTSEGEVIPWLATDWERLSDTVWRFRLREGVSFSNGEPFDADAVVNTVAYVTSEAGRASSARRDLPNLKEARAVDSLTVDIETTSPSVFLDRELAMLMIVAPGHWQALGPDAFATDPIGTGPYKVTNWGPARVELAAYEGSWRAPIWPSLEILEIPEASARLQGVLSGQVHIAPSLGPVDIPQLQRAGHRVFTTSDPSAMGVAFNTIADPRLRDIRVRHAMNYAVNKEAIVQGLIAGATVPTGQPAPRIAFGFNPDIEPYPYDPEKARALLAEAGYADGFDFEIVVLGVGLPHNRDAYQQIAADLQRVGINATLQTVPVPAYSRGLFQGDWGGATAFGTDFPTAPSLDALRPFNRHNCDWVAPWHCDPTLDAMVADARAEQDLEKREAMTRAIMAYHHEQAPAIFTYDLPRFYGLNEALEGFDVEIGFLMYHKMSLAE